MSDIGATVFAGVYASMPDARASVRTSDGTVISCLCADVGLVRSNSELGMSMSPDVQIRIASSSDPDGLLAMGKPVTLIYDTDKEAKFRIKETHFFGGMSRFVLEAANG